MNEFSNFDQIADNHSWAVVYQVSSKNAAPYMIQLIDSVKAPYKVFLEKEFPHV